MNTCIYAADGKNSMDGNSVYADGRNWVSRDRCKFLNWKQKISEKKRKKEVLSHKQKMKINAGKICKLITFSFIYIYLNMPSLPYFEKVYVKTKQRQLKNFHLPLIKILGF